MKGLVTLVSVLALVIAVGTQLQVVMAAVMPLSILAIGTCIILAANGHMFDGGRTLDSRK